MFVLKSKYNELVDKYALLADKYSRAVDSLCDSSSQVWDLDEKLDNCINDNQTLEGEIAGLKRRLHHYEGDTIRVTNLEAGLADALKERYGYKDVRWPSDKTVTLKSERIVKGLMT